MMEKRTQIDIARLTPEETAKALETSFSGLSEAEAARRKESFGANKIKEKRTFHPFWNLSGYC